MSSAAILFGALRVNCQFCLKSTSESFVFDFLCLTLFFSVKTYHSILFYPITLGGRRGTTDEFATIPFHLDLFSAALVELAKSIPVHSLILSSHLFFCLPLFLFPFTVPCRIVFAKPKDLETWPNHLSFRFFTRVRSSSKHTILILLNAPGTLHFVKVGVKGWFPEFRMYQKFANLFSKFLESTVYKETSKFQ